MNPNFRLYEGKPYGSQLRGWIPRKAEITEAWPNPTTFKKRLDKSNRNGKGCYGGFKCCTKSPVCSLFALLFLFLIIVGITAMLMILTTTITTTTSATITTTPTLGFTTSTPITNTAIALGTLSFPGVQVNLSLSALSASWSPCHNSLYAVALNGTVLTSLLSACNKTNLLLACRLVNSSVLTVAAMGLRSDVLYNCSTSTYCTNVVNGVGWYYSDVYSWGFVSNNDTVNRNSCDTSPNGTNRLCWHTGHPFGGYRCGSTVGLNNDVTYERLIYHSS